MDSEDVDIEKSLKLFRRVSFSDADRPESSIVDHNVQSAGPGKHSSHPLLDGFIAGHIKRDDIDTLCTKSVGVDFVATASIAHGCEHAMPCLGKCFGSVAAKTPARAGNENCFRHDLFLSLKRGAPALWFPAIAVILFSVKSITAAKYVSLVDGLSKF